MNDWPTLVSAKKKSKCALDQRGLRASNPPTHTFGNVQIDPLLGLYCVQKKNFTLLLKKREIFTWGIGLGLPLFIVKLGN